MTSRGWALLVGIVVLVGAIVLYQTRGSGLSAPPQGGTQAPQTITARFSCNGGKTIDATFVVASTATTAGNRVVLALSDGRSLTVPQAISASGARYANAGETFVFWNKGDTAFVTENGTTTFESCVTGQ